MACGNLLVANDFNLFIFGDHTQSNVDSEGRVAVGGNATYSNYGIGDKLTVSTTRADLIVQGNMNISSGTNFSGNSVIYPAGTVLQYTMTNNNRVPDQPLVQTPIDFTAAEQSLASLSLNLAALGPNGTVASNFGQIVLTGADPDLNVFTFNGNNVDGEGLALDTANGINIIAPSGSTILVNVGGENVGFGSYTIFRNGLTPPDSEGSLILWNLFQATTAFNQNLSILGSVLAPYADWQAIGFGNINGTLVANSLTNTTGTLEAHNHPFTGCLPSTDLPLTTTTTMTPAVVLPMTSTTSFSPTTTTTTTTASSSTTTASTTTASTTTTTASTSTTTMLPTTTTATSTNTASTTTSAPPTSSTTTAAVITGPVITATKTANVATAKVGDTITYTITVANSGIAAADVLITEVFPEGVVFILSSLRINGGRFSGVDITEQVALGTILPGQTISIQFDVFIATRPPGGIVTNSGFVLVDPPGTTPVTCNPGQLPIITDLGVPPTGQMLPVLPVFKPGITPEPGEFTNFGPVRDRNGNVLLRQPITVPGVIITPILGLTIPVTAGTLQPIVTVNPVIVAPVASTPTQSLQVFKSFIDISLFVGQRITYTVVVTNDGSTVSGATTLVDTLSANGIFIPGTVRVNNVLRLAADPAAGISLGPIVPNNSVIVRYDVLVTGGGTLTDSARATAEFLLPGNQVSLRTFQSAAVSNPISGIMASSFANFTKKASVQNAKVGDTFAYQFVISNLSADIVASDVILFDRLANELHFVSGSLRVDGIPQLDPQIGIFLGTFNPGVTRTVSFSVQVAMEPTGRVISNQGVLFFDFRFGTGCFRAGLLTNVSRVTIVEEEEE
ncbi:choice-of-anchor A family protein [Cohnella sp. AR92]|uniref:choice-of-anchor A family protein n=1 Tax=Cohnella sp. AR92 TaxID=648716 RepID=UPI00131512EA|nr:choice-of-anchor A family protein [Cohnella sp. AR92]